MAEQCIVCLDQLRAVEPPPPPPPLPGDSGSPPKTSTNSANASTSPTTADAVDDSATAPSIGSSGPSTATGVHGHGPDSSSGSNAANVASETESRDATASKEAVTGIDGSSNVQEESHDDDFVAVIQICKHTLHDTCLREWTTKANSCPICRQSFHLVDVYDKIGGKPLNFLRSFSHIIFLFWDAFFRFSPPYFPSHLNCGPTPPPPISPRYARHILSPKFTC